MISLLKAIKTNNKWYKNCKSLRKRGGKICKVCPFRKEVEKTEQLYRAIQKKLKDIK